MNNYNIQFRSPLLTALFTLFILTMQSSSYTMAQEVQPSIEQHPLGKNLVLGIDKTYVLVCTIKHRKGSLFWIKSKTIIAKDDASYTGTNSISVSIAPGKG